MSDPKVDYTESARGASFEVMSAMSALNMYPNPIPMSDESACEADRFLSESDGWAKHSMEHLRAAFELCGKAEQEHNRLRQMLEWMLVHKCCVPAHKVYGTSNTMDQLNEMFAKIAKA